MNLLGQTAVVPHGTGNNPAHPMVTVLTDGTVLIGIVDLNAGVLTLTRYDRTLTTTLGTASVTSTRFNRSGVLAATSDGAVLAWGDNTAGQTHTVTAPAGGGVTISPASSYTGRLDWFAGVAAPIHQPGTGRTLLLAGNAVAVVTGGTVTARHATPSQVLGAYPTDDPDVLHVVTWHASWHVWALNVSTGAWSTVATGPDVSDRVTFLDTALPGPGGRWDYTAFLWTPGIGEQYTIVDAAGATLATSPLPPAPGRQQDGYGGMARHPAGGALSPIMWYDERVGGEGHLALFHARDRALEVLDLPGPAGTWRIVNWSLAPAVAVGAGTAVVVLTSELEGTNQYGVHAWAVQVGRPGLNLAMTDGTWRKVCTGDPSLGPGRLKVHDGVQWWMEEMPGDDTSTVRELHLSDGEQLLGPWPFVPA